MELVGAESVCSLSHRSVPLGTEAFTVRLQIFLGPYGRVLGCVGRVYGISGIACSDDGAWNYSSFMRQASGVRQAVTP